MLAKAWLLADKITKETSQISERVRLSLLISDSLWLNRIIITPLQVTFVNTGFYLSKSTEVLAFKSTQVPKVNFLFYVNALIIVVCNICIPYASEATYNALHLINTLTNL